MLLGRDHRVLGEGHPIPRIDPTDNVPGKTLLEGEFVTADRLTLVSRVGWIELATPTLVRAGEKYRVDGETSTVVVQRLDGVEQRFEAKPSGPDSIR